MKLKYRLEFIDMDGLQMAVPIDKSNSFRGIMSMNYTAADILELLKNDTTEEEIISALKKEYNATDEQLRSSVRKVTDVLSAEGLLIQ